MIVVHAKLKVKPESATAFLQQAKIVVQATQKEEGCVSYQLMADAGSSDSFMFVEVWTDKDALNRHLKTSHFAAFGSGTKDMMAARSVIHVYQADEIKL